MTAPLSTWLALREPADTRARSTAVLQAVVDGLPHERPLRCVDLGSGTGSNIRYLAIRLPQPQAWLAVDRDPLLLAQAPDAVETRSSELGSLDDPGIFDRRHLVTASALLDLVSERWIAQLARQCRAAGAAVLFALNYDGRSKCDPYDPDDDRVLEIFNAHQRSNNKGFGAAAGPSAASFTARAFAEAGYDIRRATSDWQLPPSEAAMQRELVQGWAEASSELAPEQSEAIARWLARRVAHIDAGRSRIVVGHEDVGGWLPR